MKHMILIGNSENDNFNYYFSIDYFKMKLIYLLIFIRKEDVIRNKEFNPSYLPEQSAILVMS